MRSNIRGILAGTAIGVLALTIGSANAAAPTDWTANPGTSVDNGVITMDTRDPNATPFGTSLEYNEASGPLTDVEAGETITFTYELSEGAVCGGGQPRIFVVIDGTGYNTYDGNPSGCGVLNGDGTSTVTYSIPVSGTVDDAGVVFDNTANRGVAEITNVRIGSYSLTPNSADGCKNGGWQFGTYKNQGQCVSSFAKAK